MATKFLEPGGDADFLIGTTNGFWSQQNAVSIVSDFVHGNHIKSIKSFSGLYGPEFRTKAGVVSDAGARINFFLYLNVLTPTVTTPFMSILTSGLSQILNVALTTGGILQFTNNTGAQLGTNGSTLSTGKWYRISLAYTITNTTTNRFELFVDGVSSISATNITLPTTVSDRIQFGTTITPASDARFSDFYIDDSAALTDPGNIWVTAKRPNANGTTNNFVTQIGSGGSGYGTGHSPQVNERPLSTTNGWSVVAVGATTEEYNIEGKAVGDIDISTATIVDYLGWVSTKALVGETVQVIVNGNNFSQAITSTITLYTKIAGSATYPAGTGADIGMTTDATATTVSLYECGVVVAFIPAVVANTSNMFLVM